MKKHLSIKIFGQVQGVLFRHSARQKAGELGINGFARNEPDDSVYIEVEGEEEKLKQFLDWCRKGPGSARVEKVDFEFKSEFKNFTDFITS